MLSLYFAGCVNIVSSSNLCYAVTTMYDCLHLTLGFPLSHLFSYLWSGYGRGVYGVGVEVCSNFVKYHPVNPLLKGGNDRFKSKIYEHINAYHIKSNILLQIGWGGGWGAGKVIMGLAKQRVTTWVNMG